MKRTVFLKRIIGMILLMVLITSAARADRRPSWTCPRCGQTGNQGNYCPNCGKARPSNASSGANDQLESIPGYNSKAKIRLRSVYANSYIVNHSNPNLWIPDHAADNDETTCWQFSKKYNNLGDVYLELNLASAQTVDAIWLKSGFWSYGSDGSDLYLLNCRPRQIRAEFLYDYNMYGYTDAVTLDLKDDYSRTDWQKFSVGRHNRVLSVRLWVLSVYTGTKYTNDVCISEVMLVQNRSASSNSSNQQGIRASLLMRLATRSGPSTSYDEPGTFFQSTWQDTTVQVKGKAWDGDIWWVLVDFSTGNAKYRVWTGLKRVNVNIDSVPEIIATGSGWVSSTETRRGPGGNYAKGPAIDADQEVIIFGRENGYVEVEYYNTDRGQMNRCWVTESRIYIY